MIVACLLLSTVLSLVECAPKINHSSLQRTVITDQQKDALKFVFAHEQHPSLVSTVDDRKLIDN